MRGSRRARHSVLLLFMLATPCLAADPYADFRIPESRGFQWSIAGDLSRSSDVSTRFGFLTRASGYSPELRTDLRWFLDSEPVVRSFTVTSGLSWSRAHDRSTQNGITTRLGEDKSRGDRQSLSVTAGQSWYPDSGPWFLNTSANARTEFRQLVRSSEQTDVFGDEERISSFENASRDYGVFSSWTVGLGVGRVRSTDGVYDAWDIERRLLAHGTLKQPPSSEARLRLAQLSYAGNGLSFAHERSGKYYWREVERILREDGALAGESLDAYALARVMENWFPLRSIPRQRGLSVMLSASLDADHGHVDQDQMSRFVVAQSDVVVFTSADRLSERLRVDRDEVLGGIDVNVQRPVGDRWQFGANTEARYGAGRKRTTRITTLAQAGWLIAERWSATSTIQQFATSSRVEGVARPPQWSFVWENTLDYWLEDAWSVSLSYTAFQEQVRFPDPGFLGTGYSRSGRAFIRLRYRPAGRFALPGLNIAEHLLPGSR